MIKVTATGLDQLLFRFENIAARIRLEMKAATEEVGKYLEDATKRTFDMGGPGFPKLSPVTVALKGHDTILIDSSRFKDGITHKVISDFKGEVFPGGGGHRRIGIHNLAAIHEGGATVKNGWGKGITIRIPPRPVFLYTARRERTKVAAIYLKGIRRALGI